MKTKTHENENDISEIDFSDVVVDVPTNARKTYNPATLRILDSFVKFAHSQLKTKNHFAIEHTKLWEKLGFTLTGGNATYELNWLFCDAVSKLMVNSKMKNKTKYMVFRTATSERIAKYDETRKNRNVKSLSELENENNND